jgi:hypothetical protein
MPPLQDTTLAISVYNDAIAITTSKEVLTTIVAFLNHDIAKQMHMQDWRKHSSPICGDMANVFINLRSMTREKFAKRKNGVLALSNDGRVIAAMDQVSAVYDVLTTCPWFKSHEKGDVINFNGEKSLYNCELSHVVGSKTRVQYVFGKGKGNTLPDGYTGHADDDDKETDEDPQPGCPMEEVS